MDRSLVARNVYQASDSPENGSTVYAFAKDGTGEATLFVCTFASGKFWIDHLVTLDRDDIIFWTDEILIDETVRGGE